MREVARFAPGEIFAERYAIERLLKSGGMGAVYVARHTRTHEQLALKVMKPELVADSAAQVKFEQEARVGTLGEAPHQAPLLRRLLRGRIEALLEWIFGSQFLQLHRALPRSRLRAERRL